jgi:hypothetical protein
MSSSGLSSPPSSSHISDSPVAGPFERASLRIKTALKWVEKYTSSEHHTARLAIIIINCYFSMDLWNIVPQYYTQAGKWPDLILEKFYHRPGKKREHTFVPLVFIEFKSPKNPDDPSKQLAEAIKNEQGELFNSKGYLIGIKGTLWTIEDYHFVSPDKTKNTIDTNNTIDIICVKLDFFDTSSEKVQHGERPKLERDSENLTILDIKEEQDISSLSKALDWIGKGGKPRDLTPLSHHNKPLTTSFTRSTINSNNSNDEENPEILGDLYNHIIPYLLGEEGKAGDKMDTD